MLTVESAAVKTEHSVVATKNILRRIFVWKWKKKGGLCFVDVVGNLTLRLHVQVCAACRKGQLYSWTLGERIRCSICLFHPFLPLFTDIVSWQALFAIQLSYVLYTYGIHSRRAQCCAPWAALESLTAIAHHMDNKREIVTISQPCQKNISDMGYKQRPLINERPHDFKQPDSSCLVGTVCAGQRNMMK